MRVVGVTGGVGAGKSTVLAYMEKEYHAEVIQADQVGHEVMEPGRRAYEEILNVFGSEILAENGRIDRKALGDVVFASEEKAPEAQCHCTPGSEAGDPLSDCTGAEGKKRLRSRGSCVVSGRKI